VYPAGEGEAGVLIERRERKAREREGEENMVEGERRTNSDRTKISRLLMR
jgi:hypothetical protein